MYTIYGLKFSQNTTKVIYVAEELGIDYAYNEIDLSIGANKTPEHLERHPVGKVPTLTHDGRHLFESGAICRYLASVEGRLYPKSDFERCQVDQWMDFFSVHLGRWVTSVLFERVFRAKFNLGAPKDDVIEESLGYVETQAAAVDAHLGKTGYLAGDSLTIADLFAFAYIETTEMSDISLAPYANLSTWYANRRSSDAVSRGHAKLGR